MSNQHIPALDFLACLFLSTASSFNSYIAVIQIQAGHDRLQYHTLCIKAFCKLKNVLKYLECTFPNLSVALFIILQYVEARDFLTTSAHGRNNQQPNNAQQGISVTPLPKKSQEHPYINLRRAEVKNSWSSSASRTQSQNICLLVPNMFLAFQTAATLQLQMRSTMHTAGMGQAHVTGPLE